MSSADLRTFRSAQGAVSLLGSCWHIWEGRTEPVGLSSPGMAQLGRGALRHPLHPLPQQLEGTFICHQRYQGHKPGTRPRHGELKIHHSQHGPGKERDSHGTAKKAGSTAAPGLPRKPAFTLGLGACRQGAYRSVFYRTREVQRV